MGWMLGRCIWLGCVQARCTFGWHYASTRGKAQSCRMPAEGAYASNSRLICTEYRKCQNPMQVIHVRRLHSRSSQRDRSPCQPSCHLEEQQISVRSPVHWHSSGRKRKQSTFGHSSHVGPVRCLAPLKQAGTGLLKAGRCRRGGSYQAVEEDPSVDRAHVAGVLVEQGLGPQRGRHKRHDQVLQGPAPPARPVSASQPGYPFTLPERLSSVRAELKALEDWCSPCQNVNLGQQPWTFLSYGFKSCMEQWCFARWSSTAD